MLALALAPLLAAPGPAAPHGGAFRAPAPTDVLAHPAAAADVLSAAAAADAVTFDPSSWVHWWNANGAGWLNLRAHAHDQQALAGSDAWFLGLGQRYGLDTRPPDARQIEGEVVPALQRALFDSADTDVITGALVALAKIGARGREAERLRDLLLRYARHPEQEVSETAVMAVGLSGDVSAVPVLRGVLEGSFVGKSVVGRDAVPERTRAFAAYALGLIGAETQVERTNAAVREALAAVLHGEGRGSPEVQVAAVTALGLVWPAERPAKRGAPLEPVPTLLALLTDSGTPPLVRAHAATALARAAGRAGEREQEAAGWALVDALGKREPEAVQESAALALGRLGDCDAMGVDRELRAALRDLARKGRPAPRRFALIALAQVGARPGSGREPLEGRDECREALVWTLKHQRALRPWAALALGLHGAELRAREEQVPEDILRSLRREAARCRRPQEMGAFALALGLAGESESERLLIKKLDFFSVEEAQGHVILGLALLGEGSSVKAVREVLVESVDHPLLLWQSAVGLAVLGDSDVVRLLVRRLAGASDQASRAAVAAALGWCGDAGAVEELVALLRDVERPEGTRAFAAVALGRVCDHRALPWNFRFRQGVNYLALTETLSDGAAGVLDVF